MAFENGGWIILPLDVRLVLGMEGVFDLLVIFVKPIYMASGLGAKDLFCSVGDRVFKGRPFRRAAFGSQASLESFVQEILEAGEATRVFQPSDVVGSPDSLGSLSVRTRYVQ